MVLKNYMEDFVLDKLEELIPKYPGCCFCENCRTDIVNLALNHLPPKYVSTDKGQVFARVEYFNRQNEVEIVKQIAAAIEQVEAHPRH
ncbi:late competence development ComFB family protein [Anaerovibrio lipolyticus]|uniref:late competence development ComFB family protein n=1 Tax=Anaerovibrio lipolyticus TaxID=82374 RepID=UPI0023F09B82|nr:late competence development ComFB family protein [Anaerovibrio lipolyticus]